MAAEFDVAGRQAEGFAALDTTQTYVLAAAARGYRHPDLTLHSLQVRDWYGTEDGLDLRALDADCVTLRAAAQSVSEASRSVRTQLSAVTSAWVGEGAGAAIDFLARHADRADQVAAAVEAAARSCERLRDELWRIVDGKVDAVVSLETRAGAQRPAWVTAARKVIAGGSMSEEAGSVVDSEITPFVATAVSGEWVTAMRAAVSAVGAAYRAAVDGVASRPVIRFDIPGDFGPVGGSRVLPVAVTAPVGAPPAPVAPAAISPGSYAAPTVFEPPPAAPVAAPPPAAPAPPMPTPAPAMLGEPASALGGLPGQFADALGGLFGGGSPESGGIPKLSEPVGLPDLGSGLDPDLEPLEPGLESEEDPVPEEESIDEETPDDEDDGGVEDSEDDEGVEDSEDDEDGEDSEDDEDGEVEQPEPEVPAEILEPDCPAGGEPEPVASEPVGPEPVAPVPAPAPAADPSATPCEIAADELPQVGQ